MQWQHYLTLREQAELDWHRVAYLAQRVAAEFLHDVPHGGDLAALEHAITRAAERSHQATTAYWTWNAAR